MQICAKFAQLIFSPKSTLICAAFAQLAMCIKVQFMTQPFACRREKSTVTQKTLNHDFFVPSSRETELLLSSEDNQGERNWLGGGKTSNLVLIYMVHNNRCGCLVAWNSTRVQTVAIAFCFQFFNHTHFEKW